MSRNIILDWSGTLVDDLPPVVEATNKILSHYGRPELTREEFRESFRLPFIGFWEEQLPGVPLPELEEHYHRHFDPIQDRVSILPSALAFLEFCRDSGRRMFLLSSINRLHWEFQSENLGLHRFFEQVFVQVMDKKEKIVDIIEDNQLDRRETLFVGDMVHDVETARHGGIVSVATLTGFDTASKLAGAKPDITVHDLSGLQNMLAAQDIDAPSAPVATVGALVYHPDGKVLMVRTHKWSNLWGIPGGKIQQGEASLQALEREILEETGLEIHSPEFICVQDCIDSPEFMRKAHFILLNYTARASRPALVVLNEEAEEFRWVTLEEALALELNAPTRYLVEQVMALEGKAI